jgi:hypothetical protein
MYAVLDPRVTMLKDLRDAEWPVATSPLERERSPEAARRAAQWPTWQMDRSWPDRSAARLPAPLVDDGRLRNLRDFLPLLLSGAGVLALVVVIAVALLLPHVG